ncbi:hypothetical protein A2380_01835 [candidate division WWE3 bacterium RIFOXYB1_FULL_43_24]|nr:MAG: hypothetical protein A2212_02290 [candidate division WWE3 bacterium RIFOXYA1_FULL_42_9]OGC69662.1 MAG: hypothetical protein A2380_01835 [candidate division WWE3 bacterium RIFOXYB1_FULL_43_24]OGC73152.1 MAG: hypothetical protein A2414_00880 [candidate division WWE3 bacterium RIFOXYC1_FULL_42_13]
MALSWNSLSGWGENCDGNTTKKYKVQVDPGTGWEDVCTVDNPTSTCAFAADSTTNKTYKWRVIADNGAKTSTSAEWAFTVNMKTDITVTVQEIPTSTTTCPTTPVRNLAGASVTVSVWGAQTEDNKTFTDTTGTDGKITLSVPYSTATPPQITVCPTYSDGMCQTYGIKCSESNLNSTLQTCATVAQNTAVASQTVTMQMAKVTKDPWVAVVDGDAYAGSFTNTGPCTSETSSDSGFYLGMLNLNKLQEGSLGSNIYALSVRGSSFSTDISEGPLGGFIQNIGVEDSASQKIELKAPEGAKVMTNLGGYLRPDVYKISIADFNNSSWQYYFLSQNLGLVESQYYGTSTDTYFGAKCYPGDVNYRPGFLGDCSPKPTRLLTCIGTTCYVRTGNISPRVAFVYVEGNPSNTLVIDRPINSIEVPGAPLGVSTSPGNVVIITRAHVKIDPSLSTPLSTYTIDTPPQIEAIIISSSGIEVGSNYTEASPDNPVVFYGSLISTKSGSASGKGLQILRDLGLNNNMYPSAVVHYPLGTLDRVTKSIKFNSRWGVETGLEIFDVQYEFDDDAGEIGN